MRRCEIRIDGASRGNPGPAGVGAVFLDGHGKTLQQFAKSIGETTNNVAEYLALIYALQEAQRSGYSEVSVKTDSELLARQMTGRYKVRDPQLRVLHDLAQHGAEGFAQFSIEHIRREANTAADRLAGQAATDRH